MTRRRTKPVLKTTYNIFLALHGLHHVMLLLPVNSYTTALPTFTIPTHQSAYSHCMSDTLHVHDPRGIFQRNLGLRGWWVDWVRDIVLNMHGQDLTALKNAMDDGGDAHNIHKLIYNDILVCAAGILFVLNVLLLTFVSTICDILRAAVCLRYTQHAHRHCCLLY